MTERLMEGPLWAWMSENWPVIPVGVIVLVLVYVTMREFARIDESERGREEDVDDGQPLA